jgi:hypothetical protein
MNIVNINQGDYHNMLEKYQPGEFKWCKPAEAVFVMQHYLSKLELSLRNGEVPNNHQNGIQSEINDLIIKITRRKGSVNFDMEGFFDTQKKFQRDADFRQEVNEKIAGTWVDPVKEARRIAKEEKEAAKEAAKLAKELAKNG